jgi:hypothetical protein
MWTPPSPHHEKRPARGGPIGPRWAGAWCSEVRGAMGMFTRRILWLARPATHWHRPSPTQYGSPCRWSSGQPHLGVLVPGGSCRRRGACREDCAGVRDGPRGGSRLRQHLLVVEASEARQPSNCSLKGRRQGRPRSPPSASRRLGGVSPCFGDDPGSERQKENLVLGGRSSPLDG